MGPVFHDEPCMADGEVQCIGQTMAIIAADSFDIAYKAASLVKAEIEPHTPILSIEEAIQQNSRLQPERKIERGNPDEILHKCSNVLHGQFHSGGQEHWYLETQICLAIPGENDEMFCYSSTQHPSETLAVVAEVLGVSRNQVVIETRRLGGAFGGKETQANHLAAWASLLAAKTRKPVRLRLTRDMDQSITGKRHRFQSDWKIGFNNDGRIEAYTVVFNADAGYATDLTMAILERAMLHAENAYYIPNIRIIGNTWKTNLPSNVAFRGFGQPQGMAVIENAIDAMARFLKKDPNEIRRLNFYGINDRNTAPYGAEIADNRLNVVYEKIIQSSEFERRRAIVNDFNAANDGIKRGIALAPVKFGISFTTAFLNQAGALVHIYADGSVQVNHGGIEMGQGLNLKMLQVAAEELGVGYERIKITATNTSKIPNTSATAASSGSDLNGMAVKNAVDQLKARIKSVAPEILSEKFPGREIKELNIDIRNDKVFDTTQEEVCCGFEEFCAKAYLKQVHLSAAGFYRTPDIWFDRPSGVGKPFHYYTFGMAVSEVEVNILTGRMKLLRTDIVEDAGKSINPMIDKGQIIGGFVQGLGWVTTEDLKWSKEGKLLNASPDTYKIPAISDVPVELNVELLENAYNDNTIRGSKAVGEPPFPMAISAWLAIKDAIASIKNNESEPHLSIPATNEEIVLSVNLMKNRG
ncbi:putative xanthine dehydrogenase subunit D [bioreactor metagenome]|uniref:Putative xanthine dehydrogenase subunit D n=1 Tax=bioreactor metagenome TaxID=1076179 RepID=A0A644XNB0_9ZZZZ